MSRRWQKFVAPGGEDEPLPTAPSPWHSGRWVRLFQEHWDLIVDFAAKLDEASAAKIRSLSWAADDNEMDYIYAPRGELESVLRFMFRLASEIERAEPLVLEATDDIPDRYPNDEHLRMLSAVAAVFQEAIRLAEPFRAWSE